MLTWMCRPTSVVGGKEDRASGLVSTSANDPKRISRPSAGPTWIKGQDAWRIISHRSNPANQLEYYLLLQLAFLRYCAQECFAGKAGFYQFCWQKKFSAGHGERRYSDNSGAATGVAPRDSALDRKDHQSQQFDQNIDLSHLEKPARSPVLIRTVLRATGLYRRGISNAAKVTLRHNHIVSSHLPKAFDGFDIVQLSDLHVEMNEAQRKRGRSPR